MRTRPLRTTLLRCALLGLPVVLAVTGCRAPGALEDAGAARPVRSHPSAQPLWPASGSAPAAVPPAPVELKRPAPLPGLALDTLTGVDARTLLAADAALTGDERRALAGGCPGCEVRPAQYRDLDGDGGPELLTAVLSGTGPDAPRAVLHVYALHGREVLPVLAVAVQPDFTAETVGTDLIVREDVGPSVETSRTYRWNGDLPVLVDHRVAVTGPGADGSGCPAADPCGSVVLLAPTRTPSVPPGPTPVPTPVPSPVRASTSPAATFVPSASASHTPMRSR
ncbi:hypothetical protein ACFC6L_01035 [Kitasatospora phosalacinea]|uniref:hypothetical protein n=1 Tax=Kitasatospora phosalacinea TaxID=2065 RepID=UPI0035DB8691